MNKSKTKIFISLSIPCKNQSNTETNTYATYHEDVHSVYLIMIGSNRSDDYKGVLSN